MYNYDVEHLVNRLNDNGWTGRIYFIDRNEVYSIVYNENYRKKLWEQVDIDDANLWAIYFNYLVEEYALIPDENGLTTPTLFIKLYSDIAVEPNPHDARLTVKEVFDWDNTEHIQLCFKKIYANDVIQTTEYDYFPINNLINDKLHRILEDVRIINSKSNIRDYNVAYIYVRA